MTTILIYKQLLINYISMEEDMKKKADKNILDTQTNIVVIVLKNFNDIGKKFKKDEIIYFNLKDKDYVEQKTIQGYFKIK